MNDDLIRKWELSRRRVLAAAGGLGMVGLAGSAFGQQQRAVERAAQEQGRRVNFVVWTYGDIYTRIAKQFEADWGVRVDRPISAFNDHPTKLATMFAAGEKIDVSQSPRSPSRTSSIRAWPSRSTTCPVPPITS